jgi:predicted PurR-regulated permease PerM
MADEPRAQPSPALPRDASRRIGMALLILALVGLGVWILKSFIAALLWAAVFAIAAWPLYRRLVGFFPQRGRRITASLVSTVAIGLIFAVPFSYVALEIARESHVVISLIGQARKSGIAVPDWVAGFPFIGHQAALWWRQYLSNPDTARALLSHIPTSALAEWAREFGGELIHRLTIFLFTLLALFFLFRDGERLGQQLIGLSDRLLGKGGERVARHMISAVHGTVNGLVLVGLGEGLLIGASYIAVGLPNAVPVGALTGVLAVIPFGAPVVFCTAAAYLLTQGAFVAAAIVLGAGFAVTFVADHFIRPILIGGAARLPFLWVLLGILGGLETFGVLGLFLGPAVMAALVSIWREWTGAPEPEPASAPPPRGRVPKPRHRMAVRFRR